MNYFKSHGLETWRCHALLLGAKVEVLANVRLFSNEKGALLKVVSPPCQRGPVETLLNQFCKAVEMVGPLNSRSIPLSVAKESVGVPWLILGDVSEIQGQIYTSYSPEAVLAAPELKATWWALLSKILLIA